MIKSCGGEMGLCSVIVTPSLSNARVVSINRDVSIDRDAIELTSLSRKWRRKSSSTTRRADIAAPQVAAASFAQARVQRHGPRWTPGWAPESARLHIPRDAARGASRSRRELHFTVK